MTAGSCEPGASSPSLDPSDDFLLLHFEMAAAINRVADHSHPRWAWCLGQGMDTLLVHMAGRPVCLPADVSPDLETVLWHAQAEVVLDATLPDCVPPPILADGLTEAERAPDLPSSGYLRFVGELERAPY
jgi:hypothetical protein